MPLSCIASQGEGELFPVEGVDVPAAGINFANKVPGRAKVVELHRKPISSMVGQGDLSIRLAISPSSVRPSMVTVILSPFCIYPHLAMIRCTATLWNFPPFVVRKPILFNISAISANVLPIDPGPR